MIEGIANIVIVLLIIFLSLTTNVKGMWITKKATLGEVNVNTNIPFMFRYTGLKRITHLSASCGCTSVAIVDGKNVQGSLSTGAFPTNALLHRHLTHPLDKKIDVLFDDGTTDTLTITATLLNPKIYQ